MSTPHTVQRALTCGIAAVWLINGLLCKILGLVPRHELIVARILGGDHAHFFTTAIGAAEVGMAIWVLSGIAPRTNAALQVAVIATMNILEFILAPDLLLWGRLNAVFALAFMALISWHALRERPGGADPGPRRAT